MKAATIVVGACLCLVAIVSNVHHSNATSIAPVQALLQRLLPDHADQFQLTIVDDVTTAASDNNANTGTFTVGAPSSVPGGSGGPVVAIQGSDPVAVSSGILWYLKYRANASISWWGDQLELPSTLPSAEPTVTKTTTLSYRYYMNVCTLGYSTVWWSWERWEKEIDWMALNGINMPLAFLGQEYVWQELFVSKFGLTQEDLYDFFSGPAFLPWHRMGNLNSWAGRLPQGWITARRDLQVKVLARMRELGMKPVLPGFAGFVPEAFQVKYPNASIKRSSGWGGFAPTYQLQPTDALFVEVGAAFVALQTQVYGSSPYMNADLWNEMSPPSSDPSYLAQAALGVYNAMLKANPDAVWVMQGWLFYSDRGFWQETQMKALLNAVPHGRLVILDLYSDVSPVWSRTSSYYNTPFIWNMLLNFGGRSGLYARLPDIATMPGKALAANAATGDMVGIGLTPEAIQNNPIAYDLMMENTWRGTAGVADLDAWVAQYVARRYGTAAASAQVAAAWKLLQDSVYSCPTQQQGTSGSIVAARPDLVIDKVSCCAPLALYYDPNDVVKAWGLLLAGARAKGAALTSTSTFGYDTTTIGLQALTNVALPLYHAAVTAYNAKNASGLVAINATLMELMVDMDALAATQPLFLLGNWIKDARSWATTTTAEVKASGTPTGGCTVAPSSRVNCGWDGISAEQCDYQGCCFDNTVQGHPWCFFRDLGDADLYEWNARTQVTLWGPQDSGLTQYAYKLWSGLIADFYRPRWSMWLTALHEAVTNGKAFDQAAFTTSVEAWEEAWTWETNAYPTEPTGDAATLSQQLYAKWFK